LEIPDYEFWLFGGLGRSKSHGTEESALEVLKKRYVRDEISKEEFEEKKRDIL
jgi:uncharacterized membrane protein